MSSRYKLPLGRPASLGDSLLGPFFGGMLVAFVSFLLFLVIGEKVAWLYPNFPFYAYVITWAVAGVWIWSRGVWKYVRQLEAIIATDKGEEP